MVLPILRCARAPCRQEIAHLSVGHCDAGVDHPFAKTVNNNLVPQVLAEVGEVEVLALQHVAELTQGQIVACGNVAQRLVERLVVYLNAARHGHFEL